jgi:hypothetical protein
MPLKDPEARKAYGRARWELTKESHNRKRREDPETIQRNKANQDIWRKTPEGMKSERITGWKKGGLVGDYDAVYEIYLKTTNCMRCSIQLTVGDNTKTRKCMDHDHETNEYRAILCHGCNTGNILDTHSQRNSKLQEKYIREQGPNYRFRYRGRGKKHSKTFKTLDEAIKYKEQYLLLLLDVD